MEQIALTGELDQLLLEVLVRQQHLPLLTDEDGRRDGSAAPVQHRVGDGQRPAPVDTHDAVDQSAAAGPASVLDHVERYVEVLEHVVGAVLGVELDVATDSFAVERAARSDVPASEDHPRQRIEIHAGNPAV